MIELLNSKVVRVAMAMVAFTVGCAAPADDAGDVEVDEAEAVEVGEDSQALNRFGCGDLLRFPNRFPISSLRNCGSGLGRPWGGFGGWGGGLGGFGGWGGGFGGWGSNWFPGGGFSPCSSRPWGGLGRPGFGFGWNPAFGGAYPGAFGINQPC